MQPPKEIYIRYNRNPAGSSNLSVSSLLDSCHLLYQSGFAHNLQETVKKKAICILNCLLQIISCQMP